MQNGMMRFVIFCAEYTFPASFFSYIILYLSLPWVAKAKIVFSCLNIHCGLISYSLSRSS